MVASYAAARFLYNNSLKDILIRESYRQNMASTNEYYATLVSLSSS